MNNFYNDLNCKAQLRFETSKLLVDSIGGNTLANLNSVVTEGSTPMEGRSGARFTTINQGLYVPDSSLDSGFPLKSGDGVKQATICMWYRSADNSATDKVILAKFLEGNPSANKFCFMVNHHFGSLDFGWGVSDSSAHWWTAIFGISVDWAVHLAFVIDGVAKTLKIRRWDSSWQSATNYNWTFELPLNVSSGDLFIGNFGQDQMAAINGWIDEVVFFDRLLSDGEIDLIRLGLYRNRHYLLNQTYSHVINGVRNPAKVNGVAG